MSLEKQRDYWNIAATSGKKFTTDFPEAWFEKYVRKDAAILDVGCGYGRTLEVLKRQGYTNLCGVDFAEKMVEQGKRLHPGIVFLEGDGEHLPLESGTYDAVILFAVLTCIVEDECQRRLISEILRVLRPGGHLFVNDFILNENLMNQKRYQAVLEKYGTFGVFELPEGAILRHHDPDYIHDLLSPLGELEYKRVIFSTMNGHQSQGFCYVGQKHLLAEGRE